MIYHLNAYALSYWILVLLGNSNSNVLVVQSAQQRHRENATRVADLTRDRCVLPQRRVPANLVSNTGVSSRGELETTRSTSPVAVCCSRASANSRG
jgi:hypothetical protein